MGNKRKLTDAVIARLARPEKGQRLVWDQQQPGFGVRLTPTAVSFIAEGRVNGKTRRVTLGRSPAWKCADARKEAARQLVAMAQGIDPAIARQTRQTAGERTLQAVLDAYLESRDLRDTTIRDYTQTVKHWSKDWLARDVTTISEVEVLKRHAHIKKRSESRADSWARIMRLLFRYARAVLRDSQGQRLMTSVATDVLSETRAWRKPVRKQRVVSDLGAWWRGVDRLENDSTRKLLWTLALTGMRFTEAATLRQVDWDSARAIITVLRTKSGRRLELPVGTWLARLLDGCEGPYLFPSRMTGKPVRDIRAAMARVTTTAGIQDWTPHDLRRGFITAASQIGVGIYVVKELVGHSSKGGNDPTWGYVVRDLSALRQAMQRIEDHFLIQAGVAGANVVALRQA